MLLGQIVGTAVATQKYPGMEGAKLLVVQPVDKHLHARGPVQVAVDTAGLGAGTGDVVYLVRAREAMLAYTTTQMLPIDLAVVGVVEQIDLIKGDDWPLPAGYSQFT